MSHTLDFMGVGNISYDWVLPVAQFPAQNGKYPAGQVVQLPGGMIANATCGAARLGLRCGYVGWIGDDSGGTLLHTDFVQHGVLTDGLQVVAGIPTAFTLILVDAHGERVILLPDSPLYSQPISSAQLAHIAQARMVYSHPRDAAWYRQLLDHTHANGGLLAMDVEWMPSIPLDELLALFAETDFLFVTETFMQAAGISDVSALPVRHWAVYTQGAAGSSAHDATSGDTFTQPARRVPVVDTTGAGDCFHAATLAAFLVGEPLPQALAFATAAAALKVQQLGARGGLPTRAHVEALLHADS